MSNLIELFGKISWEWVYKLFYRRSYKLDPVNDWMRIRSYLANGHYVILTRRNTHLSTYMTAIAHFFLTGRLGCYSHVCLNVDHKQILESIGSGVQVSHFDKVFNCDWVCLLKPIGQQFDWNASVKYGLSQIGKKYDTKFNLNDDSTQSCVETILHSLRRDPNYSIRFHGLQAIIELEGNLTPQMFLECGSFEKVLEIRR